MSTKDSDWDTEDDMEFGEEFDQESEQVTPQDDVASEYSDYGSENMQTPYDETYGENYEQTTEGEIPPVESEQAYPSEYEAGSDMPDENGDFNDYDFMDEGGSYTAGDTYSDDLGTDDFTDYEADVDPAVRHEQRRRMDKGMGSSKKSPVMTIAVIAVAGVLVLGGSYFALSGLFGGSDTPQQMPDQTMPNNMEEEGPVNNEMNGQNNTGMPELVQDNIRPPSVSQDNNANTGPLTPLPGEEEDIGFFTAENDTASSGIQFDVPAEQNDENMFATPEDTNSSSPSETIQEEVDITESADDFFQSLDAMEETPSSDPAVSEAPNESPQMPVPTREEPVQQVSNAQVNDEVLSQLRQLNTNMSQLNSRIETLEDNLETVEANMNSRIAALEKRPTATTSSSSEAPAPKVEEKVSAPAKKQEAATPSRTPAPSPAPKKPSWEIRAIQVGKAVVAQRGTQGSREIAVGDSLPGLGTIQSIDYRNGQWIISGTQGTIRE